MAAKRKDTRTPEELVAAGLCMHGDGKPHFSRGCCKQCQGWCRRQIKNGKETDESLVKKGLWLPAQNRGVKGSSAVERRYKEEVA